MAEPQSDEKTQSAQLKAVWANGQEEVKQVLATEALLSYVGDSVYLTFGQIQVPPIAPGAPPPPSVEVRPVARIVLTEGSFHKVLTMLNRIGARVPGADPASNEEE